MKLERQLNIALDESRLLILLFGFQFNGIFAPRLWSRLHCGVVRN
jgi:hypothetical protein